jgi:hypothetical protein
MMTTEISNNKELSLEMLELADDDMEQVSGGHGGCGTGGGYSSSYMHGSLNLEWGFENTTYYPSYGCAPVCPPACPPPAPKTPCAPKPPCY